MQGLVEGTGFLGGMIRNSASYENAGERRQKGDDGDEQRSAGTDAHHPPVSRVEGASSAAAPMRGRDCSALRSEEHTSELQSLMRISYAVFCLKKKRQKPIQWTQKTHESQLHIQEI